MSEFDIPEPTSNVTDRSYSTLLATSDDVTRDFVISNVSHPRYSLANGKDRASFISFLLGDTSLAKDAEDDAPLLRQLENRVLILVRETAAVLPSADHFDTDVLVAVLAYVATTWPILLDALERENVSVFVLSAMRRWRHRPSVVARCMAAFRAFTITDAMRRRIMFDGAMDLTLELMTDFQKHHRVQDRAIAVIANVAFGCTHRKRRIARQGAVKKIINAMTAFPRDENIHLRGALTIRNLTYEAQVNQYIAGNEGAVEAIASSLIKCRGTSSNPKLRFQCVMALESLCREDETNRQRIIDMDDPHSSEGPTCSSPLATKVCTGSREECVNEDGDIIVEEEEIISFDASTNFRHGAALCPGRSSAQIMTSPSVSSSGCSDRLQAAIRDDSEFDVQDLRPQSIDGNNRAELPSRKNRSIIRAIVNSIRRDPDDFLLLEAALSLLTLLALHRGDIQARIGELGGVQIAIAAIKRHSNNSAIAVRGCALVRCLCLQETNRSHVTSGLPVLISTANEHTKDLEVVREVASALSNAVFEHEKNRAWVINKGGIEAIITAINTCGDKDIMVLEAGMCALRNFVDSSFSSALSAANEGALRAAVFALDRTKDVSTTGHRCVQEQAVLFLVDMARLAPQTREEMADIDAADWVENALAKLPLVRYPELHNVGDKLIFQLLENGVNSSAKSRDGRGITPTYRTGMPPKTSSRSIFGSLFSTKRENGKGIFPNRRKNVGQSMPLNPGSGRRSKRISSMFLRG